MEPFDLRPDPARTDLSAARLDRLRAARVPPPSSPPRAVFAWLLTAVLLAFTLGLIANPWFEHSVRSRLPGFAPTLTPTVADVDALETRVAALEARPAVRPAAPGAADPAAGERVARVEGSLATLGATLPATEARIDKLATDLAALTARLDATASGTAAALDTATATAARAQAMLVAGAVRRQLAAGQRLGPLEPALRRDFAGRAAPQVEAVAALGAAPVTVASLRAGLALLRPALTGASAAPGATRGWWTSFRDGLAGIVVRPAAAANGTDPAGRLDRADRDLVAGDVAAAAAEIAALPPALRIRATAWLAAAERYQAGWRGVAALEMLLLDPLPPAPGLPAGVR
jgi:uncharacterized coiled-coil protein SlyX